MTHEQIMQALKERRILLGLTQKELATKIGVGHCTIIRSELLHTNPGLDVLLAWTEALGLELVIC